MTPPATALAIAALAGLAVLALWSARRCRRRRQAVRTAWRSMAAELGGRFRPPSGPWYRRLPSRVEAEVMGVPVRLDSYTVSDGYSAQTFTRAATRGPRGHRFRISRRHALSRLARSVGAQDVAVGDPDYDDAFVVKTDAPAWLRNRISSRVRQLHLEQPRVVLALRRGRITAVIPGWCGEQRDLRALLRLVAATSAAVA